MQKRSQEAEFEERERERVLAVWTGFRNLGGAFGTWPCVGLSSALCIKFGVMMQITKIFENLIFKTFSMLEKEKG